MWNVRSCIEVHVTAIIINLLFTDCLAQLQHGSLWSANNLVANGFLSPTNNILSPVARQASLLAGPYHAGVQLRPGTLPSRSQLNPSGLLAAQARSGTRRRGKNYVSRYRKRTKRALSNFSNGFLSPTNNILSPVARHASLLAGPHHAGVQLRPGTLPSRSQLNPSGLFAAQARSGTRRRGKNYVSRYRKRTKRALSNFSNGFLSPTNNILSPVARQASLLAGPYHAGVQLHPDTIPSRSQLNPSGFLTAQPRSGIRRRGKNYVSRYRKRTKRAASNSTTINEQYDVSKSKGQNHELPLRNELQVLFNMLRTLPCVKGLFERKVVNADSRNLVRTKRVKRQAPQSSQAWNLHPSSQSTRQQRRHPPNNGRRNRNMGRQNHDTNQHMSNSQHSMRRNPNSRHQMQPRSDQPSGNPQRRMRQPKTRMSSNTGNRQSQLRSVMSKLADAIKQAAKGQGTNGQSPVIKLLQQAASSMSPEQVNKLPINHLLPNKGNGDMQHGHAHTQGHNMDRTPNSHSPNTRMDQTRSNLPSQQHSNQNQPARHRSSRPPRQEARWTPLNNAVDQTPTVDGVNPDPMAGNFRNRQQPAEQLPMQQATRRSHSQQTNSPTTQHTHQEPGRQQPMSRRTGQQSFSRRTRQRPSSRQTEHHMPPRQTQQPSFNQVPPDQNILNEHVNQPSMQQVIDPIHRDGSGNQVADPMAQVQYEQFVNEPSPQNAGNTMVTNPGHHSANSAGRVTDVQMNQGPPYDPMMDPTSQSTHTAREPMVDWQSQARPNVRPAEQMQVVNKIVPLRQQQQQQQQHQQQQQQYQITQQPGSQRADKVSQTSHFQHEPMVSHSQQRQPIRRTTNHRQHLQSQPTRNHNNHVSQDQSMYEMNNAQHAAEPQQRHQTNESPHSFIPNQAQPHHQRQNKQSQQHLQRKMLREQVGNSRPQRQHRDQNAKRSHRNSNSQPRNHMHQQTHNDVPDRHQMRSNGAATERIQHRQRVSSHNMKPMNPSPQQQMSQNMSPQQTIKQNPSQHQVREQMHQPALFDQHTSFVPTTLPPQTPPTPPTLPPIPPTAPAPTPPLRDPHPQGITGIKDESIQSSSFLVNKAIDTLNPMKLWNPLPVARSGQPVPAAETHQGHALADHMNVIGTDPNNETNQAAMFVKTWLKPSQFEAYTAKQFDPYLYATTPTNIATHIPTLPSSAMKRKSINRRRPGVTKRLIRNNRNKNANIEPTNRVKEVPPSNAGQHTAIAQSDPQFVSHNSLSETSNRNPDALRPIHNSNREKIGRFTRHHQDFRSQRRVQPFNAIDVIVTDRPMTAPITVPTRQHRVKQQKAQQRRGNNNGRTNQNKQKRRRTNKINRKRQQNLTKAGRQKSHLKSKNNGHSPLSNKRQRVQNKSIRQHRGRNLNKNSNKNRRQDANSLNNNNNNNNKIFNDLSNVTRPITAMTSSKKQQHSNRTPPNSNMALNHQIKNPVVMGHLQAVNTNREFVRASRIPNRNTDTHNQNEHTGLGANVNKQAAATLPQLAAMTTVQTFDAVGKHIPTTHSPVVNNAANNVELHTPVVNNAANNVGMLTPVVNNAANNVGLHTPGVSNAANNIGMPTPGVNNAANNAVSNNAANNAISNNAADTFGMHTPAVNNAANNAVSNNAANNFGIPNPVVNNAANNAVSNNVANIFGIPNPVLNNAANNAGMLNPYDWANYLTTPAPLFNTNVFPNAASNGANADLLGMLFNSNLGIQSHSHPSHDHSNPLHHLINPSGDPPVNVKLILEFLKTTHHHPETTPSPAPKDNVNNLLALLSLRGKLGTPVVRTTPKPVADPAMAQLLKLLGVSAQKKSTTSISKSPIGGLLIPQHELDRAKKIACSCHPKLRGCPRDLVEFALEKSRCKFTEVMCCDDT